MKVAIAGENGIYFDYFAASNLFSTNFDLIEVETYSDLFTKIDLDPNLFGIILWMAWIYLCL
jgi:hypothetical protein